LRQHELILQAEDTDADPDIPPMKEAKAEAAVKVFGTVAELTQAIEQEMETSREKKTQGATETHGE
jgi:hypothetical protein